MRKLAVNRPQTQNAWTQKTHRYLTEIREHMKINIPAGTRQEWRRDAIGGLMSPIVSIIHIPLIYDGTRTPILRKDPFAFQIARQPRSWTAKKAETS